MDNNEVTAPSIVRLKQFINSSLVIDYPLYVSNQKYGVKINFDKLNDMPAKNVARCILDQLLHQKGFWVCEYGSNSVKALQEKGFLSASPIVTEIISHKSRTVDPAWFEYDVGAISCNYVTKSSFSFDVYIRYAFRLDFLSNTIFLIDDEQKLAIHIYDRRGMDVVSTDRRLLEHLYSDFHEYIIRSFAKTGEETGDGSPS